MVRTVIVEEFLKSSVDKATSSVTSCIIHIGAIQDDKKFVVELFTVPQYDSQETDLDNCLFQLLLGLPGGCYPLGITVATSNKTISLLNIIKKSVLRLQKFATIDGSLLEPFILYKSGNKYDAKVLIDGQLKPLNLKFQSFFSTWNDVTSYLKIQKYIQIPKRNLKQWHSSMKSEISYLIYDLRECKLLTGKKFKDEKSLFDESSKAKASSGKSFTPRLILPLAQKFKDSGNPTFLIGSIFTHIFIPPKLKVEQVKEMMLEDVARSLYARLESLAAVDDSSEDGSNSLLNRGTIHLPYRVTFPLGSIELSVYLLQDEDLSQATQVASELFDMMPTSLKAHEECVEKKKKCLGEFIPVDDKDNTFRNVLIAVLIAVLAFLISLVVAFPK